ncbi:MAG: hypothetical protein AB7F99_17805, partial [Vicinamibacterales bacterium]
MTSRFECCVDDHRVVRESTEAAFSHESDMTVVASLFTGGAGDASPLQLRLEQQESISSDGQCHDGFRGEPRAPCALQLFAPGLRTSLVISTGAAVQEPPLTRRSLGLNSRCGWNKSARAPVVHGDRAAA